MPFLIITLLSGAATYVVVRDAHTRGMNPALWGTLVMCTATLGVPVYLLLRRTKTS